MAVKFGKAFGLNVTVLGTSESKRDEAISLLGADNFVVSLDKTQMEVLNIFNLFYLKLSVKQLTTDHNKYISP